MFRNMKFIFPQESINLSAKKTAILTTIIQNNGGAVMPINKYDQDTYIIMASINESEAIKLCQRLRASFDSDKFLKPEFISKCVSKGKIINMIPFRHFQQQIEQDEPIFDPHKSYQLEEKIKQKKEKMLQLLNNQMPHELIYNYESIIKKEEEQNGYVGVPFYGDDDCQIVESHLFDGLELKKDNKFQKQVKIQEQQGVREKMQWEPKGQKFVCTEGSALVQHNTELIEQLKKLQTYYAYDNDFGRKTSYSRAIGQLKSIPFKITDASQLDGMPAIGKKIQEKVKQFLQTGFIQKAEGLSKSVKNQALDTLKKVFGIGVEKANLLFSQGIKTIEDLRNNTDKLDEASVKALEYVEDTAQKIPRNEVTAILNVIKSAIDSIAKGYDAVVCGSYRRLKPLCGDIDILITNTLGKRDDQFLTTLVDKLKENLIVAHLTKPKYSKGYEMYMGICKIDKLHRRLDLKVYPREQFGSAVLYFTGSDQFNRSMRLLAQTKGYGLSDHGVFREFRGPHNKSVWKDKPIPCYREEDVFTLLKMDYVPPEKRDV